ncbi:MAG TPA: phage holin family protein [Dehalococcoidia bacterium]|nr:phage holin family protein [Dehalococcoidia bacterium]
MEVRGPGQEEFSLLGLAVRFVINVAALWLAQFLVRGFDIEGWAALLVGAAIFGGVNAVIKPVVALLACPITCLTLGLFTLVVNAAMLGLTAWLAGLFDLDFEVDGFVAAVLGALIVALVSTALSWWADANILRPSRERW